MAPANQIKYLASDRLSMKLLLASLALSVFLIFSAQAAFAQASITSVYGTSNRLDQIHTVQIFADPPLGTSKLLAFQFRDPDQNLNWRVIGDIKAVSSYENVGSNVRRMSFVPNQVGITRPNFDYQFRAISGGSITKANNVEGVFGNIERTSTIAKRTFAAASQSGTCIRKTPDITVTPKTSNIISYERGKSASGTIRYDVTVKSNDQNCAIDPNLGFKLQISWQNAPFSGRLFRTSSSNSLCSDQLFCLVSKDDSSISRIPLGSTPVTFELEVKLSSSMPEPKEYGPVGVEIINNHQSTLKRRVSVPVIVSLTEQDCRDNAKTDELKNSISVIPTSATTIPPGQAVKYRIKVENTNEGACSDKDNTFSLAPITLLDSNGNSVGADKFNKVVEGITPSVPGTAIFVVPSIPPIGQTGKNSVEFTMSIDTKTTIPIDFYNPRVCVVKNFRGTLICNDVGVFKVQAAEDTQPPTIGRVRTEPEFPTLKDLNSVSIKIEVSDDVKLKELRILKDSADTNPVVKAVIEPETHDVVVTASDMIAAGKTLGQGQNTFIIQLEDAAGKVVEKTQTITFQDGANMVLREIEASNENPFSDEAFNVKVRVENIGNAELQESKIELHIDGKLHETKSEPCSNIRSSVRCANVIDFEGIKLAAGSHTIEAKVLVSGVTDINPADNSLTKKINVRKAGSTSSAVVDDQGNILAIDTNKNSYAVGDIFVATVNVRAGQSKVSGASIELYISGPDNFVKKLVQNTGTDGSTKFNLLLDSAKPGAWNVKAKYSSKSLEAQKSFEVTSKGDESSSSAGGHKISLSIDKSSYKKNEIVTFTGKLQTDSGSPVPSAKISVTAFKKKGAVETPTDLEPKTTQSDGSFTGHLLIDQTTDADSFRLVVKYEKAGVSAEKSFSVSGIQTSPFPTVQEKDEGVSIAALPIPAKIGDIIRVTVGTFFDKKALPDTNVKLTIDTDDKDTELTGFKTDADGKLYIFMLVDVKTNKLSVEFTRNSKTYTDQVELETVGTSTS